MMRLHMLALLGLVMADTDPRDFGRLCSTGECPDNWRNVDGNCVLFMSGWEEIRARENCKQNQAEYQEFASFTGRSQFSLPVCLVRRTCGRPNRGSKIGRLEVQKNEYPWQVRLTDRDCGGSILSRHHILTTASCTERHPAQKITVWTREHDYTKVDGEVSHKVCGKTEHPEYNKTTRYDLDIAVLHLCEPLIFSEAVRPICLPDPSQDYGSQSAVVTGWGLTASSGKLPHIIQEVNVNTLTNSQCKSSKYGPNRITDNMICAEPAGSRDACGGFGGGPLAVLGQDGSYSQIGIVSWGGGCANEGYPGVYTRLTALLPWLTEMINTSI